MVLSFNEIGAYFGMKGSAISRLSRRFKETIKGDKELGECFVRSNRRACRTLRSAPSALSTVIFSNILEISLPPTTLQRLLDKLVWRSPLEMIHRVLPEKPYWQAVCPTFTGISEPMAASQSRASRTLSSLLSLDS